MLIHFQDKRAWFAENQITDGPELHLLLEAVVKALPGPLPEEVPINSIAWWSRTWIDEGSVEYLMNVLAPTLDECLEAARSAESVSKIFGRKKAMKTATKANNGGRRRKNSLRVDLHFHKDAKGVIHLFGKDGSKKLFVSTLDPNSTSVRKHAHLYNHLTRLLQTANRARRAK